MDDRRYRKAGDRESLVNARQRYGDLHDLLKSLSSKLTDVSSNVDREFLSSYRVHMLSVQSEIKQLKEDVVKGEQALNNDGTVAKLETEVKWFMDECSRLRTSYVAMETDFNQMNARHIALVEQKEYLNEQLKAIMKRNRVLQAEIDFALQEAPHLRQQHATSGTHSQHDGSPSVRYGGTNNNGDSLFGPIQEGQFLFDEEDSGEYNAQRQQQQDQQDQHDQSGNHSRRYSEQHGSSSNNHNSSGIPLSLSIPSSKPRQQAVNSKQQRSGNKSIVDHTRSTPLLYSHHHNNPLSKAKNHPSSSHHSAKQLLRNSSVPEGIGYSKSVSTADKHAIGAFRNPLSPGKDAATRGRELALMRHTKTHKQKLEEFLAEQSESEYVLERAAMDIFKEIKERKHAAAKHASIKRFPAIRSSSTKKANQVGTTSAMHAENQLIALTEDEIGIYAKTSIIKAAGGVSGLGLDQFSDNDRFSTIVKFLLNYDQFSQVVHRLQNDLY